MSESPMRLPLHPFEHYMLADSRRSHPMAFFLKFEIAESLEASRLSTAIQQCCRFHPLLAATIGRRWGRWMWDFSGSALNLENHQTNGYSQSRQDWSFDLTREPCLRISMTARPDGGTELWLQIHHACSDAKGILQFLRDVQVAYDRPLSEADVQQREKVTRKLLAKRAVGFGNKMVSYLNPASPKWKRIWKYFIHRSHPLHPSKSDSANFAASKTEAFSPAFLNTHVPFQNESWQKQRQRLNVPATLNDRFLQATFQSMAEHQLRNFPNNSDPWIRIGVPIDMRHEQHSPPFACNCSSLIFLDQRVHRIQNGADVLTEVHQEMQHVKHHRLGTVFLDCLAVLHLTPAAMWMAVRDMRCAVSVAASNLGAITFPQGQGFSIRKVDFYPPLRPGTSMSVGVSTYNGQLSLSLHFDRRLISDSDASTFLEQLSAKMG